MSQERALWLDAWAELNQGGRLLSRSALEKLPEPPPIRASLSDQLRDALTGAAPIRDTVTADLGALLDVVLEEVCGHLDGWRKGPAVGKADSERLLDGTELKPRRVLTLAGEVALVVFTFPVERIGVHKGRRSVAHALEYLRRRKVSLGMVTNGREWRLLFADPDNSAWVEWSGDRFLDAEALSPALHLLRLVLSPAALTPPTIGDPSPLLNAIRETRRGQAALSKELGENVRKAVEHLLRARLPLLSPSWSEHNPKDTYQAACHFVMRLVVVLFAESRELLPVDNPVYHQAYGLRSLLDSLERVGPARRRARTSAWARLLGLFRLLHAGSHHPQVAVPAYGGDLFRAGNPDGDSIARALGLLESPTEPPADEVIYQLLRLLTRTTERVRDGSTFRSVPVPVDFTELTSEYIGILYEGLLDYELKRVDKEPILFLGLGDQPALPLNRLEEMGDKQLGALVEKAKVGPKTDTEEGEDNDEESSAGDEDGDTAEEAIGDSTEAEPDYSLNDDTLRKARERAESWALKAAIVGKLIRAPRGKKGKDDPAWKAEASRVAKSLIVDLKLPGELYLVRWGGTRKGAGTFYTRPQLTIPTVRRTLEPLIHDADGKVRTPEEILALKICDPAMGSGSFLVAALRVVTDAVVTSLHVHGRIKKNNGHVRLECELLPDSDRDQSEDTISTIVRRAVVEHCLYGVDIDALAVELARVSLWVETLDKRLPFTFLDHKLRCGDALVGTWLDRFREYPLLAWWRQSPDEKWRGVTHEGDVWARRLKELRTAIVEEQRKILAGETSFEFVGASDEELRTALARVRELYRRLRAIPSTQPDRRAEIWRKQVAIDPALLRVRQAFDTWCALWFWPLDLLDEAPRPIQLLAPSSAALEIVKHLREKHRFFHWELEFPDVFVEPGSGFDAIVANPPWETTQTQSMEFFSDIDPMYRSYGKQEALRTQRDLFEQDPRIEQAWLDEIAETKNFVNWVRHVGKPYGDEEGADGHPQIAFIPRKWGETKKLHSKWATNRRKSLGMSDPEHPFQYQGEGKPYSYKLFLEQSHSLLKQGGQFGMWTPSGLYTDFGSRELRKKLLSECHWRWLYGFENRAKVFDIDSRFKFAVTIAAKGGSTGTINAAFMRQDIEDWGETRGALEYPASRIFENNPNNLSVLEVRSERDLDVLSIIQGQSISVSDPSDAGWKIRYKREFNATDDSSMMPPLPDWLMRDFQATQYLHYADPIGNIGLPVLSGRIIDQFDFAAASWMSGKGRASVWDSTSITRDGFRPEYLMDRSTYLNSEKRFGYPKMVFMEVVSATNERTCIGSLVPDWPGIHKTPCIWSDNGSIERTSAFTAVFNSFVFDYTARMTIGGLSLGWFILESLPVPKVGAYIRRLAEITIRLNCNHRVMAPYWQSWMAEALEGRSWQSSWAVTRYERVRLRCITDAIVGALYGLGSNDYRWILRECDFPKESLSNKDFFRRLDPKGFWRIDKGQDPELRHTCLSLVAFEALQNLIKDHGGDRDAGINAFCSLNNGEGWLIPESLRLADYGLGHDERAKQPQPVASRLGPRFLDWQLAQTSEQSWAECERHARAVLGDAEFERRFGNQPAAEAKSAAVSEPAVPLPVTTTAARPAPTIPQLGLFEQQPAAMSVAKEPLTMSISSIRLLNFRNWTDAHWDNGIALKPITLMLGRNSAGKTSILQPLRMLKQTVEATDAGTYLLLDGTKQDGVNLGSYADVVNGHDEKREMAVGLDLVGVDQTVSGISVDVRFKQVDERPVIDSLVYRIKGERIEVTRGPNAAYQLSSPRFRLPNWDGANDVHLAKHAYEPGRAIEFSEEALKDLGSLGETVRGAIVALKEAFKTFHFLGPLRPPPARQVTWSQQDPTRLGSNGSETIQALISNETSRNKGILKQAVSDWLKRLDLADGLEVSRVGRTLLYQIEIIRGGNRSNLIDVGFGVSQVLPVIVLLHFVPEGSVILCEDPDAHLHPMAQAGLADMFVEVAKKRRLQVLIETHSEHLFRRLQFLMADLALSNDDCALYYVERDQPSAKITELETDPYGRVRNWPQHLFGDAAGETGRQLRSMVARMKERGDGE